MSESDPLSHFYFFPKQVTSDYFTATFPQCQPSTLVGALKKFRSNERTGWGSLGRCPQAVGGETAHPNTFQTLWHLALAYLFGLTFSHSLPESSSLVNCTSFSSPSATLFPGLAAQVSFLSSSLSLTSCLPRSFPWLHVTLPLVHPELNLSYITLSTLQGPRESASSVEF